MKLDMKSQENRNENKFFPYPGPGHPEQKQRAPHHRGLALGGPQLPQEEGCETALDIAQPSGEKKKKTS